MAAETNDVKGMMADDPGNAKAQPSGPSGDNPAIAGPGDIEVSLETSEADVQINPSAPGETGTTPGTNSRGMIHGHRGARVAHPA